jgi:hypothetical protein
MKKIQDVPVWYNGQLKNAQWLNVIVSSIMLGVSAQISFELFEGQVDGGEAQGPSTKLVSGQLSLDGDAYADWGSDDNYIWEWAANQINVVIINN